MKYLSHFFSWKQIPDALVPYFLAEFAANGVSHLVLGSYWCERILAEPDFAAELVKQLKNAGLFLAGAHSPFGPQFDPGTGEAEPVEIHLRLLDFTASCGVETYTLHADGRDQAARHLEPLLTAAAKLGIIIALENTEHPGGTIDDLQFFRSRFASPHFGFCYDSGHANLKGGVLEVLDALHPDIVAAHLHDNDGVSDIHLMPGQGTIDWSTIRPRLLAAPRLISVQNEVNTIGYGIPIRKFSEFFANFITVQKQEIQ